MNASLSPRVLDSSSIDVVNLAFDFVTNKEHGIVFSTDNGIHSNYIKKAGQSQWLLWLVNGQIGRLQSEDEIDAGAIFPTNLTRMRLVDTLNGGNDAKNEARFWLTYNTFVSKGEDMVIALQKAVIASCPVLPLSDDKYNLVWRYKKFSQAIGKYGRSHLSDNRGVSI